MIFYFPDSRDLLEVFGRFSWHRERPQGGTPLVSAKTVLREHQEGPENLGSRRSWRSWRSWDHSVSVDRVFGGFSAQSSQLLRILATRGDSCKAMAPKGPLMTIGAKAVPPIPTPSERQCIHEELDSTHERLDSCKRNIHRLQDRVDRLREIINRDSAQTLFRLN